MSTVGESLTETTIDGALGSSDKLFLLDFWNEGCTVCKRIAPMLEDIATTYQDRLIFSKVNADENPKIVERFAIRGLPTLLFIKSGKEVERFTGVQTKSKLIKTIEDHS